jgi:hypothetical protein
MKKILFLFAILTLLEVKSAITQNIYPDTNPLGLSFQRLAVRRYIFSNNIILSELTPSEIVSFTSMHPAFIVSNRNEAEVDEHFRPKIKEGKLVLNKNCGADFASIYIGGINPYATYELNVDSFSSKDGIPEVGIEFTSFGLRNRIQVIVRLSSEEGGFFQRVYHDNKLVKETKFNDQAPKGAFSLKVQLYGRSLGVFLSQDKGTKYIGHIPVNEHFGDVLDFRRLKTAADCTFNLISNLKGEVTVESARSYLSAGMGQADIRLVSYEDMSPYMQDERLWFTFSCRGIDTPQSAQGVLSIDPTVFDVRFEGMIVFDHGDGLLRNDYASHLFHDRNAKEWRAYVCDFGGSANKEGRMNPGLLTATSLKNPLKGFSVMKGVQIRKDYIDGHNEDPCIFYDKSVNKWRLLTCIFSGGHITSRMLESDTWNGKFMPLTEPIGTNSTGTSLQKIGDKYYALMGGHGNLRVHSYPYLKELGELKLKLQPHWPKPAGRIWASVVPLPEGYPYRYILLTMDRSNFPGITGRNWSYGALYFYGANPENISDEKYEF